MKQNKFFANVASKALALAAAVMMMSAAFTACSKDSDNDNSGGTTPLPEPKAQTVTLDGVEKTVQEGKCITKDLSNGDYTLLLYLSDNHKERVQLDLNKELHMTGSLINLDKREKEHDGKQYWVICYYTPSGGSAIVACAVPGSPYEVFKEGTLTVNGSPETGDFNIQLKDGRIKGTDGKEYTLAISYIGKMKTK